jgi:hypothetical protein
MAVVTVVPDGDGTTLQWTPKGAGDHYVEVDEGIAGQDGDATEVTSPSQPDNDYYTLEAMPGDFDVCIDATIIARAYQSGRVDDSISLRIGIMDPDEDTRIENEDVHALDAVTSYTDFTGNTNANTDSKALWNTYKIENRASSAASGMPDGITVFVTAVEVVINYTATGGADQEPSLIEGKLVTNSLLLKHLVRT